MLHVSLRIQSCESVLAGRYSLPPEHSCVSLLGTHVALELRQPTRVQKQSSGRAVRFRVHQALHARRCGLITLNLHCKPDVLWQERMDPAGTPRRWRAGLRFCRREALHAHICDYLHLIGMIEQRRPALKCRRPLLSAPGSPRPPLWPLNTPFGKLKDTAPGGQTQKTAERMSASVCARPSMPTCEPGSGAAAQDSSSS